MIKLKRVFAYSFKWRCLFQMADNPILMGVVQFININGLYRPILEPGDVVRYNWMAKVMINTVINKRPKYLVVERLVIFGKNAEYTSGASSSVAWVRKATKKELKEYAAMIEEGREHE